MRTTRSREARGTAGGSQQSSGREQIFAEIDRRAAERGLSGPALAKRLGYTVSYIAKLRKGTARLDSSPGFLRSAADFLGVPPLELFVLAGFVEVKDFGPPASFRHYLDLHYASMVKDPLVAALMPSMRDWTTMPLSGRLCIVGLYQVQRQLAESLAAGREESAAVNLKAMRAVIDQIVDRAADGAAGRDLARIKLLRKSL